MYIKQRQLLKDLGQKNKDKRINMIEQQLEDMRRREKIKENCKRVRDWVKRKEGKAGRSGSVPSENKENLDFNYNCQGTPTDDLIQKALETNKLEQTEEPKKQLAKPKWAYTKKEYDDFIAEGEDCEDFMDNLNFDNFVDNLEDEMDSSKEDKEEIEEQDENIEQEDDQQNPSQEDEPEEQETGPANNLTRNMPRRHKHHTEQDIITEEPTIEPKEIANIILTKNEGISKIHSKQSIVQILKKTAPPQPQSNDFN